MSHLGVFFRDRRVARQLSLSQVARLLGYKNLSRGCNKIKAFEAGGKVQPDLLGKLAKVMEIDPEEVRQRIAEDYRDWLAWANEPIRPYMVVRILACIYQRVELPDEALSPVAAVAFAADVARDRKFKVCLVLSRRVSVWFDATGKESGRQEATPDVPCEPFVVIGGRKVRFNFGNGVGLRSIDEPGR